MPEPRPLRVFLCHASQDKPAVRELYKRLKSEGWIDPWLDDEKLIPGNDWDLEIKKAIRIADIIVVCLSTLSVTKEGYIQKEIKLALDIADEKPDGVIYIIPLRLDDCKVPSRLSKWQWIDYFNNQKLNYYLKVENYTRFLKAMVSRAWHLNRSADEYNIDINSVNSFEAWINFFNEMQDGDGE